MKKNLFLLALIMGVVLTSVPVFSADNDSHQVIIAVPSVEDIAITTGKPSVTLTLTGLGAANNEVDNTSRYTVVHNQGAVRKIAAQAISVDTGAILGIFLTTELQAPVGSAGTSAGPLVLLDGTAVLPAAVDVVTGIDKGDWTATPASIEYDAYANANASVGNNTVTVRYTLLP